MKIKTLKQSGFSTSQVAKKIGVHPNTVRLYEKLGFINRSKRSSNGYRNFTTKHLFEMQIAWKLLKWPYPGGKKILIKVMKDVQAEKYEKAIQEINLFNKRIQKEIRISKKACNELQSFDKIVFSNKPEYSVKQICKKLDITYDSIRNWERNNLIKIPRKLNNYRYFTAKEIFWLRILRILRKAGFGLMSILRMITSFRRGERKNLDKILDTPAPDEELLHVINQWFTTLEEREEKVREIQKELHKKTNFYKI